MKSLIAVFRKHSHWIAPLAFLFISCAVLAFLFVHPGRLIGVSYDWDTPLNGGYFVQNPLTSSLAGGTQVNPGNWMYLTLWFKTFFAFGASNPVAVTSLLVLLWTLSGFGFYRLMRTVGIRSGSGFVGGVLYMASLQLFLAFHHGYLYTMISYACAPFLFDSFIRYCRTGRVYHLIAGSILFSIASTQIQFFALNTIVLGTFTIVLVRSWRRASIAFISYSVASLMLSAPWILLYLTELNSSRQYLSSLHAVAYTGFQSNSIMDLLYVPFVSTAIKGWLYSLHVGWAYYWWLVVQVGLFAFPFFVVGVRGNAVAPERKRIVYTSLLLVVGGLLLAGGNAEPFPWKGSVIAAVPVIKSLFRDLNHFYYLITFGSVTMIAWAIDEMRSAIVKNTRTQTLFLLGTSLMVVIVLTPYILQGYSTIIHRIDFSEAAQITSNTNLIADRGENYRVLWVPFNMYVGFNSDDVRYSGVNPFVSSAPIPPAVDYATGRKDGPSMFGDVMYLGACDRIPSCASRFFALAAVRHIVLLAGDFQSAVPAVEGPSYYWYGQKWKNSSVETWFNTQKDIKKISMSGVYRVYELEKNILLPAVSSPSQVIHVVGDPEGVLDGITVTGNNDAVFTTGGTDDDPAIRSVIPVHLVGENSNAISHSGNTVRVTAEIPRKALYKLLFYRRRADSTSTVPVYIASGNDVSSTLTLVKGGAASVRALGSHNPMDVGSFELNEGVVSLQFKDALNSNNMIVDPSMTNTAAWSDDTFDCSSKGDATIDGEREGGALIANIHNRTNNACRSIVVGEIRKKQKYLISVDIKNVSGSTPSVCVRLDDRDDCIVVHDSKSVGGNWKRSEMVFESGDNTRVSVRIEVPGGTSGSHNYIRNVELREVELPSMLAFVGTPKTESRQAGNVEFRRISSTKYQALFHDVQGTVPIVLNEPFHQGWNASVVRAGDSLTGYSPVSNDQSIRGAIEGFMKRQNVDSLIDPNSHKVVNGTNNLWHLRGTDQQRDYEIVIEFKPQRFYIMGQLIALTTITTLVGVCLVLYVRTRTIRSSLTKEQGGRHG